MISTRPTRRAVVAGLAAAVTMAPAVAGRDIGSLAVETCGGAGPALLLIPGLAGGAWCFEETIRRLPPDFSIHVVTLPGFDGRPAIDAPPIERVAADLARYIEDARLDRPILVGHSLGAFLALRIGMMRPGLIGGLVTIDGYPVFPPLAGLDPAARAIEARRRAEQFYAAASDPVRFRATMREFMAARMNDPQQAERFAEHAAGSDPRATGDYVVDMLSADLRPELPKLAAPLLALVAPNSYLAGRSEPEIRTFYTGLLSGAPQASLLLVRDARHFMAQDRPDVVSTAIEAFVAGLGHARA